MDDRPPAAAAPGVPRTRTRGARRRVSVPTDATDVAASAPGKRGSSARASTAFPALPTSQTRLYSSGGRLMQSPTPATHGYAVSEEYRGAVRDEDGCARSASLRDRLHGTGLKRSLVQAQLFPDVADAQRAFWNEALEGCADKRLEPGQPRHSDNQATVSAEECTLARRPLVEPPNARPVGTALIPSRPTTSFGSSTQRRRLEIPPKTARKVSSASRTHPNEPMTARDRYYVAQRATTAPTGARRARMRPPSTSGAWLKAVDGGSNQNISHAALAADTPRRSDLLARKDEVKTLTESIAESLTRAGRVGYGSSMVGGAVLRDSFLYLRRVDSNPYNLAVTNHAQIDPKEYYTVSRLGITHFSSEGLEFQPLEEFERENYIYALLVKLPFFKKYRVWKRFTLWKRTLYTRKRVDAVVSLTENLFILLPHLHDALFQLRRACLDLQQVNLFDYEHAVGLSEVVTQASGATSSHQQQRTYTLSEFSIRLKAQKIRTERLVDRFISDAEMIAKHACERYLYSFLQKTGFNKCSSATSGSDTHRRSTVAGVRKIQAKLEQLNDAELDPERTMTYTERATMRTQCRQITKFLRVVDFLISDALLRMAISSAARLKDSLLRFTRDPDEADTAPDSLANGKEEKKKKTVIAMAVPLPKSQPLFRVEVTLRNSTPPSIGHIGALRSPPRITRTNTSFRLTLASSPNDNRRSGLSAATREREGGPSRETDDLLFSPNTENLRSQLETLIFNGLMAVTNRERVLLHPMFKVYVDAAMSNGAYGGNGDEDYAEAVSEGMDLDILIMEDAAFVETLQNINSIVLDAYERAEESCDALSVFLGRYQANKQFCKQVALPSFYLELDVHDFREFLDKYTKEVHDVDAVADNAPCGLLLLDRAKLNAVLKPSPQKCLDTLHMLIPVVFRQLNDCLMDELTVNHDRISTIPTSVEEFSASLGFLRQLQSQQDAVDEKYAFVRSLYHLLEEYKVKLTDADQMNAFLLSQKTSQLKTSMDLFEGGCEQYTTKFGIELEGRLPNLVLELTKVSAALSNSMLFELTSDTSETIDYLTRVEGDLTQLEADVDQHFTYEKTLGLPLTTAFEELENVKTDLALKLDMWGALREWKDAVRQWEKLRFPKEVDIPAVEEGVERFHRRIAKWEQNLSPGMGVLCAHLKARVEEYRHTMPILTDLRCTSFEERHFSELHTLLGFGIRQLDHTNSSSKRSITLGELVQMHLSPFSEEINRIATEATQEKLLKEMLDKIIALWENMEFEIKPYKETKEYFVLASLESIYATLEESLVSMTAVLSSKFLAPIKNLAVIWQKRLLVFQETLDAWIECQRKWMHLETIFSAPDIQKQLPNEGVIFLSVNQFWKDLMRRTRDQRACLKVSGAILVGTSNGSKVHKEGESGGRSGVGQALLDTLMKHNSSLERLEKSLEDYLETKRRFFPRFFFISNDELLEILAHAKEPQAVQRHLCKFFDALVKLDINNDAAQKGVASATTAGTTATPGNISSSLDIVAMLSPEGERVPFGRTLKARGNVEDWLNSVLTNMKVTLHRHVKSCLLDYQHAAREMWVFRHPAQAVAVVSYIIWAKECEICFRSPSQDPVRELSLWHQTICTQLSNLTRLVRTSLTSIQRRVVVSLVTTDVHFRDVVEVLVAKRVTEPNDFIWEQQLRYRWHPDQDDCEAQQANCRIKYGYEYMGACSRLVITPLTDRCWMTITGALELRFGAAPSGPAGTGKTETSKDLAKALGILCIVINCSDQMDYTMMNKIFNGVVQAGSWVCLDEFNRIDIEVLSVVAQQMTALRNARLMHSRDVLFDGQRVPLRDHHIIVTMNPGYAGRTELPDNLKVSFRPVAMMVPDYALIAEILLFAEGFQLAKPLSRKVTKLYKLCSEQLSRQPHYDFGMRAVKSVLTMAGSLKRSSTPLLTTSSSIPASVPGGPMAAVSSSAAASANIQDENEVLIRAMIGANSPKLTDEDTQLFKNIVKDLFPDTLSSIGADESRALLQGAGSTKGGSTWMTALEEEIGEQLRRCGLQSPWEWTQKMLQLFATLEVRVGVVQTGSSGSGKSTAMRVLRYAVTALRERKAHPDARFQRVVSFILNPKAISMMELYGFFHPVTREWTDGLASKLLRTCIVETNEQMMTQQYDKRGADGNGSSTNLPFYWITFDGPIDALWIESMNTVLDDNKTLCLANGERIKLLKNIQLLFEVEDTASASPATISRLGVVYYHSDYLGWQPYVASWVAALTVPSPQSPEGVLPTSSPSASNGEQVTPPPVPLYAKAKARIVKSFDLFIEPGLAFIRSTTALAGGAPRVPIATSNLTFVTTVCHIFQSLLELRAPSALLVTPTLSTRVSFAGSESAAAAVTASSIEEQRNRCLDLMFLFSFAWSFGGNLNLDYLKKAFQAFLLKLVCEHGQFLSNDILAINGKIPTPPGMSQAMGDIQEFFIDFQWLSFSPWANAPQQQQQQQQRHRSLAGHLLVPTVDVLRYQHLVELLAIDARKPVLLTGATGSGKSAMVHHLLDVHARIAADTSASDLVTDSPLAVVAHGKILPLILNFSAQTQSAGAQLSIESKFTKKRKTLLGAPVNKQLVVVFVDDVNMPSVEKHSGQPVIELLRQYLEFSGLYDREKFFWKDVADSVLIAAGGLPGGGRHTLSPRFVRHFSAVFCLPSCDEDAMKTIFNFILESHIASCIPFTKPAKEALLQTAGATCELFQCVVQGLLPTPSKTHYLFNLRDVARLMQGIVLGTRTSGPAPRTNKKGHAKLVSTITAEKVASLWAHEAIRVFRDRLVNTADRKWFSEQLVATANSTFGLSWILENVHEGSRPVRRRRSSAEDGGGDSAKEQPLYLLFSPMKNQRAVGPAEVAPTVSATLVKYKQVKDLQLYEAYLNAQMVEYNGGSASFKCAPLQLVLFKDAMVHTAAIARILIQPRGHALLLGMGGCGKRSLTRLAAFVVGYRCFEIEMTKHYGLADFREDLKMMMLVAALGEMSSSTGTDAGGNMSKSNSTRTMSGASSSSATGATPTVFLLNDLQLVSDAFLEDINTILNGGDIPKLFAPDELEKIISDVRMLLGGIAANAQCATTSGQMSLAAVGEFSRKDCEDYFHLQVQTSLHVVLCMNPMGEDFRARVRQFPSLINCTTIDFFDEWPSSALQYVAEHFLSQTRDASEARGSSAVDASTALLLRNPVAIKSSLAILCMEVHQSIGAQLPAFFAACRRRVVITSQHYLDLIALFQRIYREKKARWETKFQRLMTGVVKLEETNDLVSTLQDELVVLQPVLVEKTKEAEELLAQVAVDQVEAGRVAQRVVLDETEVKQQQQNVAACQADAKRDLDQALPALKVAVAALDALDKKDITEVKGFVKPPQAVQVVMEAVCIMLGEKADWDNSKRILSRSTFMVELKEYDKNNIPPATLKKIRKYIESPEFAVEEVKKVSRAAMSLCMWVHAVDTYARVFREVGPKRQRLAEMNGVLEEANAKLADKQRELAKVMERARKLKEQCDATLAEKQRLIEESELTQERLHRAEKLTVGLQDERVRWKGSIELLTHEGSAMLGDSFLAAACISYLGPFDGLFRGRILRCWADVAKAMIDVSPEFTLADTYGDVAELREWQLLGLPSDSFSADNAVCVMKGKQRWPLMIDPQQQASQWIKRLEAHQGLQTVKSDDGGLMQVVEQCLHDGNPLLIEDVTEILDPSLEPVLEMKTTLNGASSTVHVQLGGRFVKVDTRYFRLYLTTKLANPHFVPDVFIRVNVINFTVTSDGLEEQLLSDVVRRERMEVEERKHALLASIYQDQKLLQEIEIKILNLLSEAKGNILDDIELIQTLETSKETSTVVAQRLAESEATKQEVLEIRNQYHGVAERGAVLFFVIADLADIDPMYQFSLEYFSRLFNGSLQEAPESRGLLGRLEVLKRHLTLRVYQNICRGLFQAHKQLFAFVICLRILAKAGDLNQHDIRLLDRSTARFDAARTASSTIASSETDAVKPNAMRQERAVNTEGRHDSVSNLCHEASTADDILLALAQKVPAVNGLLESYYRENRAWTDWINSDNPYVSHLPGDLNEKLPPFLRLVLVRWLREEVFTTAVQSFIAEVLGEAFLRAESKSLVMSDVYRDMDRSTPCLFILSLGADPIASLVRFARDKGIGEGCYHVISLGQGQGPIAEVKLREGILQGHWLVLQNVHLAKSWLPRLQSLLVEIKEDAQKGEVHEDFRLFLASFPAAHFPISILQNSVKVTTEPPKGVKANLQRSMILVKQLDDPRDWEEPQLKESLHRATLERRLAFGLSFFHAVIQERFKFGTLGWNLKYDFSDADFVSVLTLQRRLLGTAARSNSNEIDNSSITCRDGETAGITETVDIAEDVEGDFHGPSGNGSQPPSTHKGKKRNVPWDALLFLTGEIYYGGRVTDEFDRRCLMAILRRFCSAESLAPQLLRRTSSTSHGSSRLISTKRRSTTSLQCGGVFASQDGSFRAPEFRDDEDMAHFVDALPEMDDPQVFGMHPNAHISHQRQQGQRLVELAMQLEPPQADANGNPAVTSATSTGGDADSKNSSSAGTSGAQQLEQLALAISKDLQERLPSQVDFEKAEAASSKFKRDHLEDPLAVVLEQELATCHAVLRHVSTSLEELKHAIQGTVVMSVGLEQALHSLAGHQVPLDWHTSDAAAAPTKSLTQWMGHLLFRCDFLHRWASRGRAPCNTFPLSVFSFPQSLLTAILQRHARKHVTPIHYLDFHFRVVDDDEYAAIVAADAATGEQGHGGDTDGKEAAPTTDGAYLSGMVLEGARWDSTLKCLCSPRPGIMRQAMPIIRVLPQYNPSLVTTHISVTAPPDTPPSALGQLQSGAKLASTRTILRARNSFRQASFHARRKQLGDSAAGLGHSSASVASGAETENAEPAEPREQYSCPVYRTAARKGTLSTTGTSTNLVLAVDLPCEGASDTFVLNGAALICCAPSE